MRWLRLPAISLCLLSAAACSQPTAATVAELPAAPAAEGTSEGEQTPPQMNPPPVRSSQATAHQRAAAPPPRPARASSPAPLPQQLPPSPSPLGWSGVVMRLEFDYPAQRMRYLGTGFVVRDRSRADWLLTCAHLIGEKAWEDRYQVKMRTMKGDRVIRSFGTTLHVGVSVDVEHGGIGHWPDMTQDLVIRLVAGEWVQPMRLAPNDPEVGDWVWAVGCEARRPPSDEKLFLGQVVEVARGGFVFRKQVAFDPHGFSGGPVINTRGEVVGNVLAGGGPFVSGATVSTLRQRLKAKGVSVD